ncbi:MAG: hypothetical protein Q8N45_09675 [Anaerolineales bacterium]|nr:hypothetical protein [Anaerolineales bacterium]
MTRTFTAVIHKEDDWYVADCPEVGTVSQGKTVSTFAAIPFLIILACTLTTISPVDTSQPPVGATETAEVPSLPRWRGYEQALSAVLLAGTGEEASASGISSAIRILKSTFGRCVRCAVLAMAPPAWLRRSSI